MLYGIPGMEGNEFVFCDNKVFYIPISVTNPLKPGSAAFNLLADDGCAAVQPRPTDAFILYAKCRRYLDEGHRRDRRISAPVQYDIA